MKYNVKRMKIQVTYWEKISAKDVFRERLLSRLYKGLLKLINEKTNYLIKRCTEDLN